MKKILLLIFGALIGFFAAHQFGKSDTGKRFFQDIDRRVDEVTSAAAEGYKKQENALKAVLKDVEAAINNLGDR